MSRTPPIENKEPSQTSLTKTKKESLQDPETFFRNVKSLNGVGFLFSFAVFPLSVPLMIGSLALMLSRKPTMAFLRISRLVAVSWLLMLGLVTAAFGTSGYMMGWWIAIYTGIPFIGAAILFGTSFKPEVVAYFHKPDDA